MIKLIDKGKEDSLIEFSPRDGRRKNSTFTRPLEYGHVCPWCNNVVQAMFYTDKQVDLSMYEETRVMGEGEKNDFEVVKIIPNSKDDISGYKVNFYETRNGNGQLIRLKNHIVNWAGMMNSENYFEVGERCCKYAGIYSLREKDVFNEFVMILGTREWNYYASKWSPYESTVSIDEISKYQSALPFYYQFDYKIADSFGKARPLVFGLRSSIRNLMDSGKASSLIKAWSSDIKNKPASGTVTGSTILNGGDDPFIDPDYEGF